VTKPVGAPRATFKENSSALVIRNFCFAKMIIPK
jgi:hypothetical protein